MKILYLITGLGVGGAERVVVDLATQMHLRGHQVKIIYLKGDVHVKPELADIEVICIGLDNMLCILNSLNKFNSIVAEFKPDIVHAHMVHANIFARISRLFKPFPRLICTAHNSNEGGKLRMLIYHFTNRFSDLNTNVSKEATSRFIQMKAFDKNAIAVYNGVNLDKFKKNRMLNKADYIGTEKSFTSSWAF